MKPMPLILFLFTTCFAVAAEWPAGSATKHAYLEVIIANNTGQDVDETGVYFGHDACTAGVVGSHVEKGYIDWEKPVTTNAVVRWRDAQGVRKRQAVKLVGVYDPKSNGALTFIIGTTNATVRFKTIKRR